MLLSEKLLENARAAIDEARQHADEINKLSQCVQELEQRLNEMAHEKAEEVAKRQQVEEEIRHLKAENMSLGENLTKETARATSLEHEVDRLRVKLVGPKIDEGNATPPAQERVAKLEAEVEKLRRNLDYLWKIETEKEEKSGADDEDPSGRRWVIWRFIVWVCAIALGGWLIATYLGLLK
jgi:small-conductance mechanosensitive channel